MSQAICAVATPPGRGGIGVVRISGSDLEPIAAALIGSLPLERQARLTKVMDSEHEVIDRGLALYFSAPDSFTGEHVLELHLHGSPVVLEKTLAACVAAGARRAGPGEFSQRAFLNGKLDLAQAEAIADLIAAGSEQAARAASRSLEGAFSETVNSLAERITALRVWVEAAMDFPDEEIDFLEHGDVGDRISALVDQTDDLLRQASAGCVLNDGLKIAIVGKPNAGKSSLFNALVRREAAIVTEIPGTTRDVLREQVQLGGIPVTLADTAGLRETLDPVEIEGVRRARAELAGADLLLWVVDVTDPEAAIRPDTKVPLLRIDNKIDLLDKPRPDADSIALSATSGAGLERLDQEVANRFGLAEGGGEFTARARHIEKLQQTCVHLGQARSIIIETATGELVAEELKLAAEALGEITGQIHSDDLLGRIFSSFCIGK